MSDESSDSLGTSISGPGPVMSSTSQDRGGTRVVLSDYRSIIYIYIYFRMQYFLLSLNYQIHICHCRIFRKDKKEKKSYHPCS